MRLNDLFLSRMEFGISYEAEYFVYSFLSQASCMKHYFEAIKCYQKPAFKRRVIAHLHNTA